MPRPRRRFTLYDALEDAGHFEKNPANADSRDSEGQSLYAGPVEYPKMFYHPEGETRITVPGEDINTPRGPKTVGEQREIIWEIAANAEEEEKLRADGWHDHPSKAIAVYAELNPDQKIKVPSMGAQAERESLQAQIERLTAERDQALAAAG